MTPYFLALSTSSEALRLDTTMTRIGASPASDRIASSTSYPLLTGIRRSKTKRSGCHFLASSIAALPSYAAWVSYPAPCNRPTRSDESNSSSSATRTFVAIPPCYRKPPTIQWVHVEKPARTFRPAQASESLLGAFLGCFAARRCEKQGIFSKKLPA